MGEALKPPFIYFGGKATIAGRIAALLPPHEHYVEPFAGSLAVLLAKRPSSLETVNDLASELVAFWRVLRDRPAELERVCALTPHSREEHQHAYEPVGDDLERARRTWVRLTQGRSGQLRQRTGWRFYETSGGSSMPGHLRSYVARLGPVAERLAAVSIECRPALEVIAAYGRHPGALIYADPPYLDSTRTHAGYGDVYVAEMRYEDSHRELADALRSCRGGVLLSGYRSPLYEELYDGWHAAEIVSAAGNSKTRQRTEVVWSNRPFPQGSLFDQEAAS
jgi:DNA adenine methylase